MLSPEKKRSTRVDRGFDSIAGFSEGMTVVSETDILRGSKCWRQVSPAASQRHPSAHRRPRYPWQARVPAEPASVSRGRPTLPTSQLLIQIIRTPPRCLQKSSIPGLPTIIPDGPFSFRGDLDYKRCSNGLRQRCPTT